MSASIDDNQWECASCLAWNWAENEFCMSCGRDRDAPAVEMSGMKRYKGKPPIDTPWVTTIRRETGLIEHVCQHGVGHPAWASAHWLASTANNGDLNDWLVHGCDGCCNSQEWQEQSLRNSIERAHEIIIAQQKEARE